MCSISDSKWLLSDIYLSASLMYWSQDSSNGSLNEIGFRRIALDREIMYAIIIDTIAPTM